MSLEFTRITPAPVPSTARQSMVRMRDGVRLATDVYLPEGDEPVPAVLVRLPYDKNSDYVFMGKTAERFTARGYALVVQDVRGKFRSEGATSAWSGEVNDGYDSIEWIVNQEWSDRVVGMFGDSYYGFAQWTAVAGQHPALRAIVPRVTSTGWAPHVMNPGDPSIRRVPWMEGALYLATHWVDRDTYDYQPDYSARPLRDAFEQAFEAIGARSSAFDLTVPRPVPVDAYGTVHPYDARPVPVLHCVGWFDNIGSAQMYDYTQLAKHPGWAAVQYLSADSTDHENNFLQDAPRAGAEDHARNDEDVDHLLDNYTGPALDFYDVFLKGSKPLDSLPRVSWHLGHVGWQTSDVWPPEGARTVSLFLTDAQAATGAAPGGTLSEQPDGSSVDWRYDPEALIPSAVPNSWEQLRYHPDERATADREDVLLFTGAVLAEPLDLAGPVELKLDVESTAPTFDVLAKLLDVAPDGATHMIVRGNAQGTGRGELRLDLGHTGYRVRPGHRLALLIASSDFPLYVPNSGTDESPWLAPALKPSTQTLHTGSLSITVLV
ncbi:CocE/NonD family hydrolase [Streptomyces sp. NBC_01618]|uniref:CocE/NonD family hydrolase n=1 Tax=Streptomyces sp. NBC_01618 TaxID=2975900 RepID=UPI003866D912|nr:CocE/NonD family hydrolase [Streptomyces sp. NBC_01618]